MTTLVDRVGSFCSRHGLLALGPVAVAVSGGRDSLALLHLLRELDRVALVVLTVDHGLRPGSAEEVARTRAEAESLGLPCRSEALDLQPGPGLQARARAARCAWFERQPELEVALGHHLDDQAETVLDRLARGSGSRGLAAMRPRRGRYVRPLLEVRRAELTAWLEARGVGWSEDPSNRLGTRGRLRHEVLPALAAARAGAARGLARSGRLLAEDDDLLQRLAAPLILADGIDEPAWRRAETPLRRRALLALAPALTARQVDDLLVLERPGAWIDVMGGERIVLDGDRLRRLPPPPGPVDLQLGTWGLWRVEAAQVVTVRAPEPGEMAAGTALRERLRAAGIGPGLRAYHPVVVAGGRRWVPGVWLEEGRPRTGLRVVVHRPAAPSVPPGGPFRVEL